jgi:hypothetical protein
VRIARRQGEVSADGSARIPLEVIGTNANNDAAAVVHQSVPLSGPPNSPNVHQMRAALWEHLEARHKRRVVFWVWLSTRTLGEHVCSRPAVFTLGGTVPMLAGFLDLIP